MADKQPPTVVEGATTGDVEDEIPSAAKSAEDRKAASALASLDAANANDDSSAKNVDHDAVNKAMKSLGGAAGAGAQNKKPAAGSAAAVTPVKSVKVDAADVALVVDQLELSKPKATELLRAHDGDAVRAMSAFVTP
ncbi:mRNA 3'-end-processing protein YTH1 [Purpureocillium lavendulum]|uniref:mRNA 3'-end-processing protein YTH1 n=1 Tax=Purpureocillium lavendulum TaxID=1247861 RepID=A0AB34FW16_9HYPO|nr:mRNA 3'-end-processing protein YTH1 [Purpureocillium lavendulum]